jgi:hypothetical protein
MSFKPSSSVISELLHTDYALNELIDGDLGALIKARRFVRLEVR